MQKLHHLTLRLHWYFFGQYLSRGKDVFFPSLSNTRDNEDGQGHVVHHCPALDVMGLANHQLGEALQI